ncbi:hypothetical protein F53441_4200 [Fusarium austroafricanum]|uniref:Fungal N-terminal domain-containing protein n=1 Tax=Fusarium austroafricanum TaxID=2364996 RepID=A0A8H4NVP6_9HYPO|nr:hypothetical protein F53441_4200 [Fusarium austroafricanum]
MCLASAQPVQARLSRVTSAMSGLEILGAVASSIALVQAVKGTLKAIDFLRKNSEMKKECNKLRKEILMIDCFIMQAREQTDPMMPAQRLHGSIEHPLVTLTVQELEDILEELNDIVEKYSGSRKAHDPKRLTDKMKWFSDTSKIEELRERAQATKSNLHMAITFRVSSMVDRGNVRQEVNLASTENIWKTLSSPLLLESRLRDGFVYFPDDIVGQGYDLLIIATFMKSSECIDILLKLWENILPRQGLSREVGYFLVAYLKGNGSQMDKIINKVLPFVHDWEEVGTTKVHRAAEEGEVLDALREQPWAIDQPNEKGLTPVHLAVLANNFEGLEQLIAAKVYINQQAMRGYTPLMVAAMGGIATMIQKLLEYTECRRHIDQRDVSGQTALHYAARTASPECVQLLLEAGAFVSKSSLDGETSLHWLTMSNPLDQQAAEKIIELLLGHGVDLEAKDSTGCTPVLNATLLGNVFALKALVNAGASLISIDSSQRNILHKAAFSSNFDVVNYLAYQNLENINPQLRDLDKDTPLGSLAKSLEEDFFNAPKPSFAQQQNFIKLHFDLLIRDLERHMLALEDVSKAVEERDSSATTELLNTLVEKNAASFRQDLVDWYRGLQFYVKDENWDCLGEAISEEYDETAERAERAAIARGKTITDPEMEEFF